MNSASRTRIILGAIAASVLLAVYANHFDNGFHFDDSHAVERNAYLRSLKNIPRFFIDSTTFSALPHNQSYRPLLSATLAVDYAASQALTGNGLQPRFYHIQSFAWFVLQLVGMYLLFSGQRFAVLLTPEDSFAASSTRRVQQAAAVATFLYALHPVAAETVNYVIQRGDMISTAAVVWALVLYQRQPRAWGWHLPVMLIGCLAKPPAVVVAPLVFWFEFCWRLGDTLWQRIAMAVRRSFPALLVAAIFYLWQKHMTPAATVWSTAPAWTYWGIQPLVWAHYFSEFFWPNALSADTDWEGLQSFESWRFVGGVAFVVCLLIVTVAASWNKRGRAVGMGLMIFVVGLLPTSLVPLSEVLNDHRMYLPYVGLVWAVVSLATISFDRLVARYPALRARATTVAAALFVLVCAAEASATVQRNRVWFSEETLWADVVQKSPKNGRGLMNYGLTRMAKGQYKEALELFERAHVFLPNYSHLETNLGIVRGELGEDTQAEAHFRRALTLANIPVAHPYYARWLTRSGRHDDARDVLAEGVRMQPDHHDMLLALVKANMKIRDFAAAETAAGWYRKFYGGHADVVAAERQIAVERAHLIAMPTSDCETVDVCVERATLMMAFAKNTEALALLNEATHGRPESWRIQGARARALYLVGDSDAALHLSNIVLAADPDNADAAWVRRARSAR